MVSVVYENLCWEPSAIFILNFLVCKVYEGASPFSIVTNVSCLKCDTTLLL